MSNNKEKITMGTRPFIYMIISYFGSTGIAHVAFTAVLTLNAVMLVYDPIASIIFNRKERKTK